MVKDSNFRRSEKRTTGDELWEWHLTPFLAELLNTGPDSFPGALLKHGPKFLFLFHQVPESLGSFADFLELNL